ncbi:PfkB family carbohydrate kinase [Actinoplanes sp. RD1]|uniref:PfkB family carbohydrate kinase n=1 Tax=Actinoplanes sp. RD1 TaxID=3064538 RepID=UPI0027417D0D|nr:PfkB family carbohydrate kinase [Actinoplanes sp. RD1]
MSDRPRPGSADEQVLCHALEKLRGRGGLRAARLRAEAKGIAEPLLDLPAVRRWATLHDLDLPHAAVAVVTECVRTGLRGSERIVADAVLGLGAFGKEYARAGVEPKVIADIASDLLSRRRRALLGSWSRLHAALGVHPDETPSDRSLRGSHEGQVLRELAQHLLSSSPAVLDNRTPAVHNGHRLGRVVVVGGAVMDATFKTRVLPAREMSSEAYAFDLSPGGKGLMQAMAASRLGLEVSLLAAVADDPFGAQILDHLRHEGVDTSMMKVVEDVRSPFTGIIEFELGDSLAVNWRNDHEVRLDVRDVERALPAIAAADALLVTFEIPRESLQRIMSLIAERGDDRPLVIVTPGQPYDDGVVSGKALAQVDYLVAHQWEIGRYGPPGELPYDTDPVADRLLGYYGVETVCIPVTGGCRIYSTTASGYFDVPTIPSPYRESSAARDAFCAALAAKLIDQRGEFSESVALWATAAMAAAAADHGVANPMPDRRRIDQMLARSRLSVVPRLPRDAVPGAPGDAAPGDVVSGSSEQTPA